MQRTMTRSRRITLPLGGTLAIAVVVTIAVVLLAASPALASSPLISTGDGSWIWQAPRPQGNDFNDTAFVDDVHGWAVGDTGTILLSDDGGATWTSPHAGTDADLYAIGWADAQSAWVAGAAGTLLATSDGGATWSAQHAGVAGDLDAVAVASPRRAWVAGSAGVVLRTEDGGSTWTRLPTGAVADLHAIEFVDAVNGWASGSGGTLLHTTDGGTTWTVQDWATSLGYPVDLTGQVDISELSFVDADTGWAFGGWRLDWWDAVFMRTTDGGLTWTTVPPFSLQPSLVSDIEFTDADQGWAVTQQNDMQPYCVVDVYRTSDGGASWASGWGTSIESEEFSPPFPVSLAVHGDRAWLAGSLGRLARTLDGWSWNPTTTNHRNRLDAVDFADASTGWAAGSGHEFTYGWYSTLIRTTDGGADWSAAGVPDCGPLYGVACFGNESVVAVGFGGVYSGNGNVAFSRDGGATWDDVGAGGDQLNDVDLVSADRGWAVGSNGGIFRTDDGGASWQPQTAPGPCDFQAVDFVDGARGWVVGTSGTVLATTDGGDTWEAQSSDTWATLSDVAFADALTGWVAGEDGAVLRTSDGGRTWNRVAAGVGVDLFAVAVSGRTVRIAGTDGTVVLSRDAGMTWRIEAVGSGDHFLGLAMVDADHAWVVGHAGSILATSGPAPDVTPPLTTDDAPSGWVNHGVTVTLSAADEGSGVARTEYRLGGGEWTTGTQVIVAAPADHSSDGVHAIAYRSVDIAGNVEAERTCEVRIDTRAPSVVASPIVFARYGRPAVLTCTARDPEPNGGSVTVRATGIRTSRRHPWSATATTAPDGTVELPLPEGLARGAYRVTLSARDAAGNAAAPLLVLLVVR